MLFLVPVVGDLYTKVAGTGQANLFLRAIVASIFLLPPTLLMGATLPGDRALGRGDAAGVAWLGYFYGGNLAGAVVGSMLAGYYLLRVYDMPTTTYVAVALNVLVAAARTGYCEPHEGGRGRARGVGSDDVHARSPVHAWSTSRSRCRV